jgi:catechol 2,3-dioxygenase-like lactoylglutathione lyase family enzyme
VAEVDGEVGTGDAFRVEHVDFVSFLTQDLQRAKAFYAGTLGLEIETEGPDDMEFRVGQVTLDIFNPASQGQPFAPTLGGLSLRVPDVAAARSALEAQGRRVRGRDARHGRVPHGLLSGPGRERAHAPPALRAALTRVGRRGRSRAATTAARATRRA